MFQNYALFPHLSIFENVAYGLRVRGQAGGEIAKAPGVHSPHDHTIAQIKRSDSETVTSAS